MNIKMKVSNIKLETHLPKLDFTKSKVGIQIGEKSVKIVELEKKKSQWETKQSIIAELPKGMVTEGKILQPELLGLKIKDLCSKYNIKVKRVSVFIEELPFFIRQVSLPKMHKKEQERAILYHTKMEIPVNSSELTIRYSILSKADNIEQKDYMIFAAYHSLINKVVEAIHAAGLSIQTLTIEPNAIYEGLKYKNLIEKTDKPLMFVKMDSHRMLLAIYYQEKLVYSRYVPCTMDQEECTQEIQRTIISWNGKHQKRRIEGVVLIGEKDRWDEVKRKVEEFMPLTVRLITSPFTACFGIAIKNWDRDTFYTDKHTNLDSNLSTIAKVLIPIAIIFIMTFSYVLLRPMLLQKDMNNLQEKVHASNEVVQLVQEEELLLEQNKDLLTIQENIKENQLDILGLYGKITDIQTEGIHLTQLIFSKNVIKLSGTGNNQVDIIAFFKGLQKQPEFQNAHLTQSNSDTLQVQFTIEITREIVSEG